MGYGEDFLIVPTPNENWRNRRVTILIEAQHPDDVKELPVVVKE